ncbi:MAG: pectin acetylesterase-family hydrolase [Kofleriaceae bacterium]
MRTITILALLSGCALEPDTLDMAPERKAPANGTTLDSFSLLPEPLPVNGGAYAYTPSMPAGANLWRVPLAPGLADDACVDLSDPVFYVHAAPANSPHVNDWIVFVPGGGAVQGPDAAVAAWFGYVTPLGEIIPPSHGEMSSQWAAPSIGPGGILDPNHVLNPFADWNMVFIHKCSIDRFMGRRHAYTAPLRVTHNISGYNGPVGPVGGTLASGTQIKLAFRGHDIVDAVIDTLATTTVTYDDGTGDTSMPSLASANTVLFIGHSGGSRGATNIIDDVAARIRAVAANPVDVRLVMDAGFFPSPQSLVNGSMYSPAAYPTNDPANGGDPLATYGEDLDNFQTEWQADIDATCLANEVDPSVCGDTLHLLMNWIETPMFVRQDVADSHHATGKDATGATVFDCWQVDWDPTNCYGDTFALAGAVIDQVADLALLRTQALTHTVLGTTVAKPSGFFPACGHHDGAHTDDGFYDTLTAAGIQTTYANSLLIWYRAPNLASRLVEQNVPAGNPTVCPGETP